MHFVFIPGNCLPFHGKSLDHRPLGGTETGVIKLAQALSSFGHEVSVVTEIKNPPLTEPLYVPIQSLSFLQPADVLIGIRDWRMALYPLKARVRLFLTGDSYDQPISIGIGDKRVAQKIDRFLTVSDWQASTMSIASGFPRERMSVIRNGISREQFSGEEMRIPKSLIYSSTPYRGLSLLPEIFAEIRHRHPDATLQVMSGYDVYNGTSQTPKPLLEEFDRIRAMLVALPGVTFHGNILQRDLTRAFMRTSILAYPNTFPETSCITAMEAQAGGCVPVTSAIAALPETVGDAGILMKEKPGSSEYQKAFIEAIDALFQAPEKLRELSERARKRSLSFSWNHVAARLMGVVTELLSPKEEAQSKGQVQVHAEMR